METMQQVKLSQPNPSVQTAQNIAPARTTAPESFTSPVAALVRELLSALGEDPAREGLLRTPERVARMYGELLAGYQTDLQTLVNGALFETNYANMVLVRGIPFYSLCEHHMLPFYGTAHVAYIPDGRVIGLSKIPRIVEMFARRLQIQENMTQQVAETLQEVLQPRGVAVVIEGTHLCAVMRGVKKEGTRLITRAMLGDFQDDVPLRQDFYAQIQSSASPAHPAGEFGRLETGIHDFSSW